MNKLNYFLQRLTEPSTHAALGVAVAIFGGPAGLPELVTQVAGAALATLAFFLPEKKAPDA